MINEKEVRPIVIYKSETKVAYICINCGATKVIPMSQWKRGNARFCSTGCGTSWRNKYKNPMANKETRKKVSDSIKKTHKEMKEGSYVPKVKKIRRDYRRIAFENKEHKCEICGETNYGVLEVHHKDMNRRNNNIDNLMIVCSKCHHLEIHNNITIDLGHSFILSYKKTTTRSEGSETNELISKLKDLIKDLEDNNSIAHKLMVGETGGPSTEGEDIVQST